MTDQDLTMVQPGWDVFASDGDKLGSVKEVGHDHLVVEKGSLLKQEVRVPREQVVGTGESNVTLAVSKAEFDGDEGAAPAGSSEDVPPMEAHDPGAPERSATDTTTMTGAGYGAGAGASGAGSLGPVRGPDAQTDRAGGAGRGGTSDLAPPLEKQERT